MGETTLESTALWAKKTLTCANAHSALSFHLSSSLGFQFPGIRAGLWLVNFSPDAAKVVLAMWIVRDGL